MTAAPDRVKFDQNGLVPVVAQDAATGDVLTLAYANREAVEKTLSSGEAHYYSRSRSELWRKGATSGNTQRVVEVKLDCDGDALLYRSSRADRPAIRARTVASSPPWQGKESGLRKQATASSRSGRWSSGWRGR